MSECPVCGGGNYLCLKCEYERRLLKIPSKYQNADFERDFPKQKFKENESLYIHGPVGTGKTHLAMALAKMHMKKFWVEVVFYEAFLIKLRSSFDSQNQETETEFQQIEPFKNASVLVLDDLGGLRERRATDYALDRIFEIIDSRYINKNLTIVSSNKDLNQLSKDFDDRIASRLVEMCHVINLTGEDRRIENGK